METPWAFKTSNDEMDGDLSDRLVSAFLWDLADGTTDEVWDGDMSSPGENSRNNRKGAGTTTSTDPKTP